jgi:hypothetical protein
MIIKELNKKIYNKKIRIRKLGLNMLNSNNHPQMYKYKQPTIVIN